MEIEFFPLWITRFPIAIFKIAYAFLTELQCTLSNIKFPYICDFISELSFLFLWSLCLFLFQNQTALITWEIL